MNSSTGDGASLSQFQLLEARLAEVFRDVLAIEAVHPDDDFFALGGHSLAAGKIIGLVRREMGVRVPLFEFFDEPTVHGLTSRIIAIRSASPV